MTEYLLPTVIDFVTDAVKGYGLDHKEAIQRILLCVQALVEEDGPHVLLETYASLLEKIADEDLQNYDQNLTDCSEDIILLHVRLTCRMMVMAGLLRREGEGFRLLKS